MIECELAHQIQLLTRESMLQSRPQKRKLSAWNWNTACPNRFQGTSQQFPTFCSTPQSLHYLPLYPFPQWSQI